MKKWRWMLWWVPPLSAIPVAVALDRPALIPLALLYVVIVATVRGTLQLSGYQASKPREVRGFPVLPPTTDQTGHESNRDAGI
jgi:hypothetical protein